MISSNDVVVEGLVDVTGSGVSVTNFPATQPVSGSVSVSNFPATQPVSGSVSVSNFPATQPVSGTVSVGNVVSVITAVASTATLSKIVLPNNVSTTVLASNANRKSAIIFVPKSGTEIFYGSPASATDFTYSTSVANSTIIVTGYTGQITAFGPGQTINATELV